MNTPLANVQRFSQFVQNFRNTINLNPRDVVQEMLNKGQMSQQQFEALRRQTNQIMGTNN